MRKKKQSLASRTKANYRVCEKRLAGQKKFLRCKGVCVPDKTESLAKTIFLTMPIPVGTFGWIQSLYFSKIINFQRKLIPRIVSAAVVVTYVLYGLLIGFIEHVKCPKVFWSGQRKHA
jgi:hypothetical protein